MPTYDDAALRIQRKWQAFVVKRNLDGGNSRELACIVGKPLKDTVEVLNALKENKIIIQANGSPHSSLVGHSGFYVNNYRRHLMIMDPHYLKRQRTKPPYIARYPIKYDKDPYAIGAYAVIVLMDDDHRYDAEIYSIYEHLCLKKSLYVMHDSYAKFFEIAFKKECEDFQARPNSFGLHYNCNRLVLNVLRRIIRLSREATP